MVVALERVARLLRSQRVTAAATSAAEPREVVLHGLVLRDGFLKAMRSVEDARIWRRSFEAFPLIC